MFRCKEAHDYRDVGGRVMQDDSMDGIGRVESGTETEQLPRDVLELPNVSSLFSYKFTPCG